jgi:hypothetical protein
MNEQLESPPRLDASPAWIAGRRDHLVRELAALGETRARPLTTGPRRWRVVAVALVVLALASGVAIAATQFDLLDWLRSDDPSTAAFSIDRSRVVSGAFPDSISCAEVSEERAFTCMPSRTARWVYTLYNRVESRPRFTRELALAGLEDSERAGAVTPSRAEVIRADLAAVGDEFFERIDLLATVSTISSQNEVRPGVLLVPPAGVPQFVTCEDGDAAEFTCRRLAESTVPVGAPIYGLLENDEWVEQPFEHEGPRDVAPLFEALFGRPLTAREERLVIVLGTASAAAEPEGGAVVTTTSDGG